jgi:hypothetical protein
MSQWQPIETASKDGTRVLVYNPSDRWVVTAWHDEKGWTACDSMGGRRINPTHWMPLPAPPEAAMITDEHRAKAREILSQHVLTLSQEQRLSHAIAQALAEQQEKDAKIAEKSGLYLDGTEYIRGRVYGDDIAAAIRSGGGNGSAP